MMPRWMWMAGCVLLAVMAGQARATNYSEKEYVCPACAGKLIGGILGSTNNMAGPDADFCEHASGAEAIGVYPITCPKCYYSGYEKNFAADVTLTKEQKDKLRQALKPMRPIEPAARSLRIRACVRYDLIAQTRRALGEDDRKIADAYLKASWGERMEELPSMRLSKQTRDRVGELEDELVKAVPPPEKAAEGEERGRERLTDREIRIGRELRAMAGHFGGDASMAAFVMAVDRLRPHGEYAEIRLALAGLKGKLPEAEYAAYAKAIQESMEMEQLFQGKAVDLLEGWVTHVKEADERLTLTYLCGELRRRRGEMAAAEKFFAQAAKMEGSEEFKQWMKQQEKRRGNGL